MYKITKMITKLTKFLEKVFIGNDTLLYRNIKSYDSSNFLYEVESNILTAADCRCLATSLTTDATNLIVTI